jgi:hypothetical protein
LERQRDHVRENRWQGNGEQQEGNRESCKTQDTPAQEI